MAQGFRASGLHVPIKVMPIGTEAPSLWPPWHVSSHKPEFTFLVLANLQPRKGVVETATAFVAAFGPNNASVALRVHAKWGDHEVLKDMESFRRFSNIHVSIGTIDDMEMQDLWREADCVVALSKGEGWGLVPREALRIGIPVIVSGIACGISSYTYDLFGDMKGVGFARTWSEVFVFARMFRLRALHIQHEHGLHWDDNEFLHTLNAFQARHPNVALFVTMHSLNLGQQDRRTFYHR
jgi:glycosyltransferase involved in cell wall biosynthesis